MQRRLGVLRVRFLSGSEESENPGEEGHKALAKGREPAQEPEFQSKPRALAPQRSVAAAAGPGWQHPEGPPETAELSPGHPCSEECGARAWQMEALVFS